MKRPLILLLSGTILLAAFLISSTSGNQLVQPFPDNTQSTFEQYPPYATRFWVQRLQTLTKNKENLIFRVQYEYDGKLPEQIRIYSASNIELTFKDDGVFPDITAGDKKYAAYKKETLNTMVSTIQNMEAALTNKGYLLHFTGHNGTSVSASGFPHFDLDHFSQYEEIEIDPRLLDVMTCETTIKKENSLFITDLAIVEDQTRTYNVNTGVGNPNGAWTFGTLMDNIENNLHATGLNGFLKDWVIQWTTSQTVNGQTIASRDFALDNLIIPWLAKANGIAANTITPDNWESIWNATTDNNLKTTAPFKLTAIVNRIDLRGNSAYTVTMSNAGETRFIYTLINPTTGIPVIAPTQSGEEQLFSEGYVDWKGMNVIFEYGNPQTDLCSLRNFAQQWVDLSNASYSFGNKVADNPYKIALQAVTDQVTAANAVPTKVNGSAINRIRTNEKSFATFDVTQDSHVSWEQQDWEFRQFELSSSTHGLKLVPLTNNPPHTASYAPNIVEDYSAASPPVTNHALIDWIYSGHKFQVLHGNFNLSTSLLAGSGIVRREETQYLGFDPAYQVTKSTAYSSATPSQEAKNIRQQLSVNTCAGCHAGETKTVFTHVNALAYNEGAKYWSTIPDGHTGKQDGNLYPNGSAISGPLKPHGFNSGLTFDAITSSVINNFHTADEIENHQYFQSLSPFLTGRRYSIISSTPTWEDDQPDLLVESATPDNTLQGLFFVNDPANDNYNGTFPQINDQKWGFNDLQRRMIDLCNFVNADCTVVGGPRSVMQLISLMRFAPFGLGAH